MLLVKLIQGLLNLFFSCIALFVILLSGLISMILGCFPLFMLILVIVGFCWAFCKFAKRNEASRYNSNKGGE